MRILHGWVEIFTVTAKEAARNLVATLREPGECLGATAEDPLPVNFVAHSHGGNVVLEALRWPRDPKAYSEEAKRCA